eukprot:scaffold9112_cov139-Isochrysis_galbana.AAC.2
MVLAVNGGVDAFTLYIVNDNNCAGWLDCMLQLRGSGLRPAAPQPRFYQLVNSRCSLGAAHSSVECDGLAAHRRRASAKAPNRLLTGSAGTANMLDSISGYTLIGYRLIVEMAA